MGLASHEERFAKSGGFDQNEAKRDGGEMYFLCLGDFTIQSLAYSKSSAVDFVSLSRRRNVNVSIRFLVTMEKASDTPHRFETLTFRAKTSYVTATIIR